MHNKKITIPLEVASIKDGGYHCFCRISINGHNTRMLLDTGASRTIFDIHFIKEILGDDEFELNEELATGLGSNQIENYVCKIEKIHLGKLEITNFEAGVLDLTIVNSSYEKLGVEFIAGVVGSDLLVDYNALIDFESKLIHLHT